MIDMISITSVDQLKEKQDKQAADLAKKKEAFKAGKTLGVSVSILE